MKEVVRKNGLKERKVRGYINASESKICKTFENINYNKEIVNCPVNVKQSFQTGSFRQSWGGDWNIRLVT